MDARGGTARPAPHRDDASIGAFVERGSSRGARWEARALPPSIGGHLHGIRSERPLLHPPVPDSVIHLVTAGRARVTRDTGREGRGSARQAGEVDVVPHGTQAWLAGEGPIELLSLSLPWPKVRGISAAAGCEVPPDLGLRGPEAPQSPAVAQLLLSLWTEAVEDQPLSEAFCGAALSPLVILLLRLSGAAPRPAPAGLVKGGLAPWQVKRVTEYVEANLSGSLSVEVLARLCALSPSHFARAFHKSIGKPPHADVTDRRLAAAERLRPESDLDVTETGPMVGYVDGGHLARAVRKARGLGPMEFRRSRLARICGIIAGSGARSTVGRRRGSASPSRSPRGVTLLPLLSAPLIRTFAEHFSRHPGDWPAPIGWSGLSLSA